MDKVNTACDFHELHSKYNEMILDCIPERVHLGKRSHGWQFLWDFHDGRYFKANLESIKEFLKDKIIVDEYGEVFSLDQFLNIEIAEEYSGKTIDNIIVQMEARKKEVDNAH